MKNINTMDNRYNGFKELENSILEGKTDQFQKVQTNLQASKGTFDFIGNIVTLYLPQVFAVIGKFLGGEKK